MPSVLITGASRGIGRATAEEFLHRGWRVVATARHVDSLDGLDGAERLALDVTDQAAVEAATEAAGEIDTLISNAGNIVFGSVEATPVDEILRLFAQNTAGAMRVTQAVLPGMRSRGRGRLLYTSSVVGRIVLPGNSAYAASKWALEALVESLAFEVGPLGIKATLLEPGQVATTAFDDPLTYRLPKDPYPHLLGGPGVAPYALRPEEVAAAFAEVAQMDDPPLRFPVGDRAKALLAARKQAPDDVPFVPARRANQPPG
jgi:NAD(P)-dependent dehydrogenase (short-subunit alcohol dehydrogenase family)